MSCSWFGAPPRCCVNLELYFTQCLIYFWHFMHLQRRCEVRYLCDIESSFLFPIFFFFTFAVNYSLNSLQLIFKTFQRAHVETDTAQKSTRRLSSVVSLITTYTGPLPNHLGFLLSIINVSLLFGSSLPSALKIIQGSRFLSAHFFLAFHRHQPLHWLSSLRPFL